MIDSQHELTLAGVPIDGLDAEAVTPDGYRFSVAADGLEFRSSEAVEAVVRALWADGSEARIDGHDNAVTTFRLMIEGQDHAALAQGEAAFRRLLPDGYGDPVDLVWRGPDGTAPAAIRTILTGTMSLDYDDMTELETQRIYEVALTHIPFVRSEFETVAPVMPVTPDTTVEHTIDTLMSPTGWSITNTAGSQWSRPGTVTASGGILTASQTSPGPSGDWWWRLTRSLPHATSPDTPYLIVETKFPNASNSAAPIGAAYYPPGAPPGYLVGLPRVKSYVTLDGWVRTIFRTGGSSLPNLVLYGRAVYATPRTTGWAQVRVLKASNNPGLVKRRQSARIVEVGGTERTPGSLHIASRNGSSPLGLTIVHTSPDGAVSYDPDLSRWVTAGAVGTPDSAAPMGEWREALSTALDAEVPVASLPLDTYQIGLLVRSSTTQRVRFSWGAGTYPQAASASYTGSDGGETWVDLVANQSAFVGIGSTTLPTIVSSDGRSLIRIIQSAGAQALIGGMWLFRAGRDCGLTAVRVNHPHLWLNTGDLSDVATVLVGNLEDQSDAYSPTSVYSATPHVFRPDEVATYVVTDQTDDPATEFRHFHRWPFNPADDGRTE